jgi:predicted Fe-Mo cluster-binding NifX family protein
MENWIVAFSTDNGKHFIDRHSGDAKYYDLYQINSSSANFIKRIENNTGKEERHADPLKAKGISELLKKEGVQVMVAKRFGPNIKRIKSKFVCVMMNDDEIAISLKNLQKQINRIEETWEVGEERGYLNFKQ